MNLPRALHFAPLISGFSLIAALSACGGGGGGSSSDPPPATSTLTGTAATGAAMAQALITVTDRSGASVCTNAPVTTNAIGAYSCTLSAQAQSPLAVVATDPSGLVSPMISLLATLPAAGSSATANVSPLTTAIAAQLDANKDAFALAKTPALLASLNTSTLDSVTDNVVTQLGAVLQSVGVDPASFDPFTTPFVGGSGTAADALLDQVRVTFDNGTPHLTNALNPNAPPVPLAGADPTSIPTVSTSVVTSAFSLSELAFAKTELERCFAVPAAQRAPNPDTVNRRLTGVTTECQGFVARVGNAPNVDIDFLNNGYVGEVYFYGLLTSSDMDGARFNSPELMRYVPRTDGRDEALLNIKFVDKNGAPGNRILTAKKFPGSRTSGTQWWLIGNQRPIDVSITTTMRRREQGIPSTLIDSSSFFDEVTRSRYDVGLQIFVQRPNNGGTVNGPNNPNNALRYVRVKGPGLPPAGLVLGDVAPGRTQSSMNVLNVTGSIPSATTSTQQLAGDVGNIYFLQRTRGVDGGRELELIGNPGVWSALEQDRQITWAHPLYYGQAVDSNWRFDVASVPAWSLYTFEAFCGTASTPCQTFTSRIVSPVLPATSLAGQPWHAHTAATRAYVQDGAPATNSLNVSWVVNPLAQRVTSLSVSSNSQGAFATVPVGSASQMVSLSSGTFPALSVGDLSESLQIQMRYLTGDGSFKVQDLRFN